MKLTKSQEQLRDLALKPAPGVGIVEDVVLCQSYSGVSTLLRHMSRAGNSRPGDPAVLALNACTAWEALCSLSILAGTRPATVLGYTGTASRAFDALEKKTGNSLTLIMEDAHQMKADHMERLIVALEWVAEHRRMHIRAVFLLPLVFRWDAEARKNTWQTPRLPARFMAPVTEEEPNPVRRWSRAKIFQFSRAGLDELRADKITPAAFTKTA